MATVSQSGPGALLQDDFDIGSLLINPPAQQFQPITQAQPGVAPAPAAQRQTQASPQGFMSDPANLATGIALVMSLAAGRQHGENRGEQIARALGGAGAMRGTLEQGEFAIEEKNRQQDVQENQNQQQIDNDTNKTNAYTAFLQGQMDAAEAENALGIKAHNLEVAKVGYEVALRDAETQAKYFGNGISTDVYQDILKTALAKEYESAQVTLDENGQPGQPNIQRAIDTALLAAYGAKGGLTFYRDQAGNPVFDANGQPILLMASPRGTGTISSGGATIEPPQAQAPQAGVRQVGSAPTSAPAPPQRDGRGWLDSLRASAMKTRLANEGYPGFSEEMSDEDYFAAFEQERESLLSFAQSLTPEELAALLAEEKDKQKFADFNVLTDIRAILAEKKENADE